MQLKPPKNDKYQWTTHSIYKMQHYGLSFQRVVRVIRNPERTENGIVKNTIAVMQPASIKIKSGKKSWSQEIWAMYQLRGSEAISNFQFPISPAESGPRQGGGKQIQNLNSKNYKPKAINSKQIKIISAWRYPGVSPKKDPIPEEILHEINELSER